MTRPHIKPRIITKVSDLPKPTVFYNNHRKIYLLVSENHVSSRYLVMGDEQVEVVKLKHAPPVRDEKGFLPDETTSTSELIEYEYDLKKAANKFFNSLLPKSTEAVRELCKILGKPVPEVTEEEVAKKAAKAERMKKVREALIVAKKEKAAPGEHRIMTASGLPSGAAIVTVVKGSDVPMSALNEKQTETLSSLIKAGGTQTVSQLRKATGNSSTDAAVNKLFNLGLVTLS